MPSIKNEAKQTSGTPANYLYFQHMVLAQRDIDRWDRIDHPEINPHMYVN